MVYMRKLYVLGFLVAFLVGMLCTNSWGQVNLAAGGTVTENFTIGTSATATLPVGWRVDKSTALRTVGSYSSAGTATELIGAANIMATAANGIYNYGSSSVSTDRSVGGLSSNTSSKSVNVYVDLYNNGALSISSYTISYNAERYRNGSNSAGFSIQMYYSTDGSMWTAAGSNFLSSFGANINNAGAASVPIETKPVTSQVLTIPISTGSHLFLAWNYSVTSGTTTSNAQAIGIDDVSITAIANATITSAQTGNWSSTSTWIGGVVPASNDNVIIASGNLVTLDVTTSGINTRSSGITTTVNSGGTLATSVQYINNGTTSIDGSFQLNAGGYTNSGNNFIYGAAGTLIFNNTSSYGVNNTDQYWPTTSGPFNVTVLQGGFTLNSASRSINGILKTASGLTLNTCTLTLNGTTQIEAGGFFASSPVYGNASLLKYNTGGIYGRGAEWTAATGTIGTTTGYPNDVQVSGNTTLDYPNGSNPGAKGIYRNLTIDAGSSLYMDYGTPGTNGVLTVVGNVLANGNLSLGDASGGGMNVAGNFTNNASFNSNGRTTTFSGSGAQSINGLGIGFGSLNISNTSGIGSGVTLNAPAAVSGTFTLNTGVLNTTSTNTLNITNTAATAISGGSTTSFVKGPLARSLPANQGSGSTYVFPVGKVTTYYPFTLTDPSTGAVAPVVLVEAFTGSSGGTADATLTSLSTTEYWLASSSGDFTGGSVSISRQTAVSPFNSVAQSATLNGVYTDRGGTAAGTSMNNSNTISSLGSFLMAQNACSPTINTQPTTPAALCENTGAVSISVGATGTGLTYQWRKNGFALSNVAPYSNVTTATMTITNPSASENGAVFDVVVSGNCAPTATSGSVTLTVHQPLVITLDPEDASVFAPSSASFKITVSGTVTTYQWQVSDDNEATWNNATAAVYSGATSDNLVINNSTGLSGNKYRCVVTGLCGTATSAAANLTVNTPAYIWTNPITGTDPGMNAGNYIASQVVIGNISVSGISKGAGINGNPGSNRYNANNWNSAGIDLTKYFSFTLTPNSGYKINFTSLVYSSQASPSGPLNFGIRSSVDGFAANIAMPPVAGGTISFSDVAFQNVNTAITFRVYAWGASQNTGTFSINDFTFNGIVGPDCVLPSNPVANASISPQTNNIYTNGFTANWGAVAGSTSYSLEVSTSPTFSTVGGNATDLFFSEYVEGSGNNKYLEIFNGTGAAVNLANYQIRLFSNGLGTLTAPTQSLTLSGTLNNNSVTTFKNSGATAYNGAATINDQVISFNGNDALGLYRINTSAYVDIFGRITENPGTAWTNAGFTTLDKTLVRKSTIISGVTTNPLSGFPTLSSEWDQYGQDNVSNLGTHTFSGGSTPLFISGYPLSISGGGTVEYSVTALAINTNYYYRLKSVNACGSSSFSNVVSVTTNNMATADYRSRASGLYNTPNTWEYETSSGVWVTATQAPGSTNNVTILSPHTVSLTANAIVGAGKKLTVNTGGRFDMETFIVSGGGAFILSNDATLGIGSPDGISNLANTGNLQVTGGRTYNAGANFVYNGSVNQVTGNELPASFFTLSINNSGPPSNNVVTISRTGTTTLSSPFNPSLILTNGLLNIGGSKNMEITSDGGISAPTSNGGDFDPASTGTVTFKGTGTVAGPVSFYPNVVQAPPAALGVTYSSTSMIKSSLQLDANSFVAVPPIYATNSTLIYNSAGNYQRNSEWSTGASGQGVPYNVLVKNGTSLLFDYNNASANDRYVNGNLTLGTTTTAGSLDMGAMTRKIVVAGDVQIGGSTGSSILSLSTTIGGDIETQGNWTRSANGTFAHNNRAVTFNGGVNQTIWITGGGHETFAYLTLNKSNASSLILANKSVSDTTNIVVYGGTTPGTPTLQLQNGILDLNGRTLAFNLGINGTTGNHNIGIDGPGGDLTRLITSSNGTGSFIMGHNDANHHGTIVNRLSANPSLLSFSSTVNVQIGTQPFINFNSSINFGNALSTINGKLILQRRGQVSGNPPTYGEGSTLVYNNGSFYVIVSEWKPGITSGPGVPYNVQIGDNYPLSGLTLSNATYTLRNDLTFFNLFGTALTMNALGGTLSIGGSWINNSPNSANFAKGGGTVIFSGTNGVQNIGGTNTNVGGFAFNSLKIDNTSASNAEITLSRPVTVVGSLTLTSGQVTTTSTNTLTVTNTAANAVAGGSTSSFINGPISWTLPADYSTIPTIYAFPVGKGTTYLPFSLNNPTTGPTGPVIQVEAFNVGSGGAGDGTTINTVSGSEYWKVTALSGNFIDTRVSLTRPAALAPLNAIAFASAQTGPYSSLHGNVSSPSITFSDVTANLGYFTLATALPGPVITGFTSNNPAGTQTGFTGSILTIIGTNFTNATAVTINGIAAAGFTVVSPTELTAVVGQALPPTGVISITTPAGSYITSGLPGTFTYLGYITKAAGGWNSVNTWLGGNPPASVTDITIDHAVTLDVDVSINKLNLNAAKLSIGNHLLTLNGAFTGTTSNSLTGSKLSNLVLNTGYSGTLYFDQSTPQGNYLNTLTTSANVTLGDSFNIAPCDMNNFTTTGTLTVNNGVLTTGGLLVLVSDATGTARIAPGAAGADYISGDVTVQRFIPKKRAWRLVTAPVSNITINKGWQEGLVYNSQLNGGTTYLAGTSIVVPPNPGWYGIHITGGTTIYPSPASANAAGFDYGVTSGSPSIRTFNNFNWNSTVPGTLNTKIKDYPAYMLFPRGDRTINPADINTAPKDAVIRAKGTIGQKNQTPIPLPAMSFSLIGNPYPSPIDFEKIYSDNSTSIANRFYAWDSRINNFGGYRLIQRGTLPNDYTSTPFPVASDGPIEGGAEIQHIQSGQGFFVLNTNPTSTSLKLNESHKSENTKTNLFSRPGKAIQVNLNQVNNGVAATADGVTVLFDDQYQNEVNRNDVIKLANFNENFSLRRGGKDLILEERPLIKGGDTLFFRLTNTTARTYQFLIKSDNMDDGTLLAYLEDSYLKSSTPVRLDGSLLPITFNITSNTDSRKPDRFMIVFRTAAVLPINFSNIKAFQKNADIQVEWKLGNESNIVSYAVEKSVDGRTFTKVGTRPARTIVNTSEAYNWLDVTPAAGNNFYRIKAIEQNGQHRYSEVVNVKYGKGKSDIVINPNPVTGNLFSLQFVNQPKGKYAVQLINSLGQELYRSEFNHAGGSATQIIQLNNKVAKGIYQLQITSGEAKITRQLFYE
jgi:hypothetical protein